MKFQKHVVDSLRDDVLSDYWKGLSYVGLLRPASYDSFKWKGEKPLTVIAEVNDND